MCIYTSDSLMVVSGSGDGEGPDLSQLKDGMANLGSKVRIY